MATYFDGLKLDNTVLLEGTFNNTDIYEAPANRTVRFLLNFFDAQIGSDFVLTESNGSTVVFEIGGTTIRNPIDNMTQVVIAMEPGQKIKAFGVGSLIVNAVAEEYIKP